uniref:LRRCT domain-containing protein n=1 Tax=Branchiostoma floridae TaxID=7739 RepID=C3XWT3_BRAFL|eukprot:XP_002611183.1 hypothetical protein BRAFLDRAFT_88418 [Branchiostoma floridae]
MGRKLRCLLIFLLIILKEPNLQVDGWWLLTPKADCSCAPSSRCDCTDRGLTSIPQNLPTSVYGLDLKRNKITMIQKGTFANLSQLQELNLFENQITMIQAGTFVNLARLQELDLSRNKISMIQPGTFVNLARLQELNLSANKISMIQAGLFVNLARLQKLNLSFNQITMIQSGTFANLPQLQELSLDNNQMSMIQAGTFANLPQLQRLVLSNNHISMIQAGAFTNLPRLQELLLTYNQISMIQAGLRVTLPLIHELWLVNNQITIIQAGTFVNLPQLQELWLTNNQITMIQEGAFANLPKFRHLDLRNNKLSAIVPLAFGLLPSNLVIKLDGNPWQCDCKMAPFRLDLTEFPTFTDQIRCAQPAKLRAGIALISTVILTIWHKRRTKNTPSDPSSGLDSSVAMSNMNMTGTVVTNGHYYQTGPGHGNQYEDIDQHNHLGQGQSPTITESNPNTTAIVVTSGHDPQCEVLNQRNQKERGHSQGNAQPLNVESLDEVLGALDRNPIYAGVGASPRDQTSATMVSGHYQTGQGQSQAIHEAKNRPYGTGPIALGQGSLYKVKGQSQDITESNKYTIAMAEASDHDQTGQGQYQAVIEAKNQSYGTGQIALGQKSLYKVKCQS